MTASLCLDILPESQRRLWPLLIETPRKFVLYGGTALALRLGHRKSLDFDFFSGEGFEPIQLMECMPCLKDAKVIQSSKNTLSCIVDLDSPVRISFFGGLGLGRVGEPDKAEDTGIYIASVLDIAATKMLSVCQRTSAKDFVDVDALLRAGVSLQDALGAACAVFGNRFNPVLPLKALAFLEDGNLASVHQSIRDNLHRAVYNVDLDSIPRFSSHASLCPEMGNG